MTRSANIALTTLSLAAVAAGVFAIIKTKRNMAQQTQQNNLDVTSTLPRGYRNNNPLNIRINPANAWKGKVQPNTDGVFEQFSSMPYGYRAAFVTIRNYIKNGYNTIASIIGRWAPNTENNTDGYITRVCNTTGYTPYTIVGRNDKELLSDLVYAMAIVENGYIPLPNKNEIEQGWNLI